MLGLKRKFEEEGAAAAVASLTDALDGRDGAAAMDNATRFDLCEYSLSFFLRRGEFAKASVLQLRMTREGFIPSPSLRAQFDAAELAAHNPTDNQLFAAIEHYLADKTFDEGALRRLLQFFHEGMAASLYLINRVAHAYLDTRPGLKFSVHTISYLVRVHVRGKDTDGASRWATEQRKRPEPSQVHLPHLIGPYTTLLNDLAHAKPEYSAYKKVIENIQADDPSFQPDMDFFSVLLKHERLNHRFEAMFDIYERLLSMRSPAMVPHGYIFSTIWATLNLHLSYHGIKRRNKRDFRPPPNMPSVETVFQDMLVCHADQQGLYKSLPPVGPRPAPVFSAKTITAMLHTLVNQHDYAGMLVALRTLDLVPAADARLGPLPNLHLYQLVVGSLLHRIRRQYLAAVFSPRPQNFWACRFLGLAEAAPRAIRRHMDEDMALVYRILKMGTEKTPSLAFVDAPEFADALAHERAQAKAELRAEQSLQVHPYYHEIVDEKEFHPYGLPSPLECVDGTSVPADQGFSREGLERILMRATLADFEPWRLREMEGDYDRLVAHAIKVAEGRMYPPSQGPVLVE
ncbi:uncharacterized protein BXZ73DRAFT_44959 [Epithele typhae]|uniref:uncharacterized protein n=1 Tax=Epithele typhae TaxID=378194 RepID=UPI002007EFBE|nr:uncharacterized protein BXZ73DRAFT_44959 [Epithele typhae]KAH9936861.1 hypothetical protein BXZ73DRAFT_44959 [Epithele typhae]